MKKFWRGLIVLVASLSVWAAAAPTSVAAATNVDVNAKAAVAVDAKSGQILYQKNADQPLPIASMTKMISLYLVLQAIHDGKLKWTDTISPDNAIYTLAKDTSLSGVPLEPENKYTIKELYQASVIYSANDAMMLLANAVAGSQPKFVTQMDDLLKGWGISDAKIVNVTGLNNSELKTDRVPGTPANAENEMSAKDMAIVAKHLLNDYPEILDTTKISSMMFRRGTSDQTKMDNYDWMLPGRVSAQKDLPVDGLKTGTTDLAGNCFTGTAKKNGYRLITVVLNAGGTAVTRRFDQTAKLMRAVFADWKPLTATTKNQAVAGHQALKVDKGKQSSVALRAADTVSVLVPTSATTKDLRYTYVPAKGMAKQAAAPVKKGATAGALTVDAKGEKLTYLGNAAGNQTKLTAAKTVEKAGFFTLLFRGIGEFFGNLF
ncbi:D-alanyl-D-alanine carboxypeptidase family protein [Lacticaseibacillus camelliae]|nr:D-alanyl-D-alanine carboxypeptidase family protein [Lacticaseibacillus camelliae]